MNEARFLLLRSSLSHGEESGDSKGHITQTLPEACHHRRLPGKHRRDPERAEEKAKSCREVRISPSKDISGIKSGLSHITVP